MSEPHEPKPPADRAQPGTDSLPAPQPHAPAIARYEAGDRALRTLRSVRQMPALLEHTWREGNEVPFPLDRSLGRFWYRDAGQWHLLGAAQGTVQIPPQRDVRFANESNALTTADLDPLLVIPQLVRLDLTGRTIDDAILQQVAALPRLATLAVHHGSLTAAAINGLTLARDLRVLLLDDTLDDSAALAALPLLPRLRRFTLQRAPLPAAALSTLAATTTLQALTLRDCDLHTDDLQPLRALSGNLQALDLGRNPLGDALVHALALPQRTQLQSLALDGTQLTSAGARLLRACPNLHELDLSSTAVDSSALPDLLSALPLQHLALNWTAVEPHAFRHAALPRLSSLELRGNRWPADTWPRLQQVAPALTHLDLAYSALDNSHIEALASAILPTLTHLNLRGTLISDDALPNLLALAQPSLTWLGIQGTLLTRDGVNTLHAERPHLVLA